LSAAEGRRFGLTVGAAFLVLAAIAWWRGHVVAPTVLSTVGGLLVAAGIVVPTLLGPVQRGWMALAHAISKVTTPIVMGAIYLIVLTPVGVLRRLVSGNPLVHGVKSTTYWHHRPERPRPPSSMQRQF
jgi:hypothetical protein